MFFRPPQAQGGANANGPEILHLIRHDLQRAVARQGTPPTPRPMDASPWLAMRALQKAVRRGHEDLALSAAATLLRDAPDKLWRRTGCIAYEDVGVACLEAVGLATVALAGKQSRAASKFARTVVHTSRRTFRWSDGLLALQGPARRRRRLRCTQSQPPSNCTPALTGCGVCLAVVRGPRAHHDRPAEIRLLLEANACGPLCAPQSRGQRRAPRLPPGLSALDRFLLQETECGIVCVLTSSETGRTSSSTGSSSGIGTWAGEADNSRVAAKLASDAIGLAASKPTRLHILRIASAARFHSRASAAIGLALPSTASSHHHGPMGKIMFFGGA